MKNNDSVKLALLLAVFLLIPFGIKVSAVELELDSDASVEVGSSKSEATMNASATAKTEHEEDDETSLDDDDEMSSDDDDEMDEEEDEGIEDEDNDEDTHSRGDDHKSDVALIVDALLSIATRDGGIGEDVRLVAQEQASTSVKVKEDMDSLESEAKIKVFFFGPDYKSLGDLRSSIVTTQNHIKRLVLAQERTTDASVKAELEIEITSLEDVASSTEAFVDDHEDQLSLLGWFVHIFVR